MILKTSIIALVSSIALAAEKAEFSVPDNTKVPPHNVAAPKVDEMGFLTPTQINKLAENFKAEKKRKPSGTPAVATEDMVSPQLKKFTEEIIKTETGEQFFEVISRYDKNYDSIPTSANDLKFVVARMATWLPLRGIIWRTTPMIHKIVVSQQVMLGTIRNMAEQAMINFPNSHVQAQMLFLSMPVPNAEGTGFVQRFTHESDFMKYLAEGVYPSLQKAVRRMEAIPKMVNVGLKGQGVETPIVFDARIRFGENAFGDTYDNIDRFKVMGEAERFATIARLSRRMAALTSAVAYNWNGHFELRRAIGKEYGVGSAEATLFDWADGWVPGSEYINGATREKRVQIVKQPRFAKLYTLTAHGRDWMKISYFHLNRSFYYLDKTWNHIRNDDMSYVMQLDPEVLMARREQVEMGMTNMRKLVGYCAADANAIACDDRLPASEKIVGALSGDSLAVNMKAFYYNPPGDLKKLFPTKFEKNAALDPLKKAPLYKNMKPTRLKPDVFTMKVGNESTEFRNYLYGRATGWDNSNDAYGRVFPGVSSEGVADAMRIVNETRGARMLNNAFSMFIR